MSEIVIGSCLSSLVFAFKYNLPILFKQINKPFMFDDVYVEDPSFLDFGRGSKIPAVFLWEKLMLYHGFYGNIIAPDLARSIRVEEDKLKVTTEFSRLVRINFDKLHIFDPKQLEGIPIPTRSTEGIHTVIDWFNVKKGAKHNKTYIKYDQSFLNEIWFYSSVRVPNPTYKDCVVKSLLTSNQIKDHDHSEVICRLQLQKVFKELNITERPRLEHAGRDIYWSYNEEYLETDRLKFKKNHIDRITFNTPNTHKGSINKYVKLFSSGRNRTSSF
tara:strand:- start:2073 stop:2891 length:819 start_codon:yes stop_codon:yes gene_type:complete